MFNYSIYYLNMPSQAAFSRSSTRPAVLLIALSWMASPAVAQQTDEREKPERVSDVLATSALNPGMGEGGFWLMVVRKRTADQSAACCDSLARLDFLLGRWEGTQEGQPGSGTVTREYTRELNGRFIRVQNRSVYPAQPKNPKGEIHEDVGFFSLDRSRKLIVFRQFHVEGFVTQYVWDTASTASRVVMMSEAIENIPKGYRARETYVQVGPDEFEEIFEMAEPGKDFEVYSRSRLKRVK